MITPDIIKSLLRRLDSIEKTLNLQYADRNLLEEISSRLGKNEDAIKQLKDRLDIIGKSMSADVADVADQVETNFEELADSLSEKKVIKKGFHWKFWKK